MPCRHYSKKRRNNSPKRKRRVKAQAERETSKPFSPADETARLGSSHVLAEPAVFASEPVGQGETETACDRQALVEPNATVSSAHMPIADGPPDAASANEPSPEPEPTRTETEASDATLILCFDALPPAEPVSPSATSPLADVPPVLPRSPHPAPSPSPVVAPTRRNRRGAAVLVAALASAAALAGFVQPDLRMPWVGAPGAVPLEIARLVSPPEAPIHVPDTLQEATLSVPPDRPAPGSEPRHVSVIVSPPDTSLETAPTTRAEAQIATVAEPPASIPASTALASQDAASRSAVQVPLPPRRPAHLMASRLVPASAPSAPGRKASDLPAAEAGSAPATLESHATFSGRSHAPGTYRLAWGNARLNEHANQDDARGAVWTFVGED